MARKQRAQRVRWMAAHVVATLSFFVALTAVAQADVIDRMMAIVNGKVVTENDVKRFRELKQAFGEAVPGDDNALLDEVIEEILIREQVDLFPGIQITDESIEQFISALGDNQILDPEVLREGVQARMRQLRFTDLRFGQFIQPTELEVAIYYEAVFLPEAQNQGLSPLPELAVVRDLIRNNVATERINQEMAAWVESLVRRNEIEVVQ